MISPQVIMDKKEKNCLRWSMGYKGILHLYRTARMFKAIPG
jgi:hypothetical protein